MAFTKKKIHREMGEKSQIMSFTFFESKIHHYMPERVPEGYNSL